MLLLHLDFELQTKNYTHTYMSVREARIHRETHARIGCCPSSHAFPIIDMSKLGCLIAKFLVFIERRREFSAEKFRILLKSLEKSIILRDPV